MEIIKRIYLGEGNDKEYNKEWIYIIYLLLSLLALYVLIWSFTGMWPFLKNDYNSYALQAKAWLEGRLDLGRDYSYLEIAIFKGKYYVSFPPFPSYILLPFVAIFGVNTPDHLIGLISILLGGVYTFKLAKKLGRDNLSALFWSTFLLIGTNMVFVSVNGWVWFLAQNLSFTLSMMAIYYAKEGKGGMALSLWACSVGCRPFQIIYLPILIAIIIMKWKEEEEFSITTKIKENLIWAIGPIIIGGSYMILNYLRFGSVIEFGHNYLPEFLEAESGQFSVHYLSTNLHNLFRLPTIGEDLKFQFPKFDGVAFWIVSPIFLSYFIYVFYLVVIEKIGRRNKIDYQIQLGLIVLMILHLLLIASHKTLGGWHFGNRYTNDLLPYLFYGLMLLIPKKDLLEKAQYPLCIYGIGVNLIGTIAVYNGWF